MGPLSGLHSYIDRSKLIEKRSSGGVTSSDQRTLKSFLRVIQRADTLSPKDKDEMRSMEIASLTKEDARKVCLTFLKVSLMQLLEEQRPDLSTEEIQQIAEAILPIVMKAHLELDDFGKTALLCALALAPRENRLHTAHLSLLYIERVKAKTIEEKVEILSALASIPKDMQIGLCAETLAFMQKMGLKTENKFGQILSRLSHLSEEKRRLICDMAILFMGQQTETKYDFENLLDALTALDSENLMKLHQAAALFVPVDIGLSIYGKLNAVLIQELVKMPKDEWTEILRQTLSWMTKMGVADLAYAVGVMKAICGVRREERESTILKILSFLKENQISQSFDKVQILQALTSWNLKEIEDICSTSSYLFSILKIASQGKKADIVCTLARLSSVERKSILSQISMYQSEIESSDESFLENALKTLAAVMPEQFAFLLSQFPTFYLRHGLFRHLAEVSMEERAESFRMISHIISADHVLSEKAKLDIAEVITKTPLPYRKELYESLHSLMSKISDPGIKIAILHELQADTVDRVKMIFPSLLLSMEQAGFSYAAIPKVIALAKGAYGEIINIPEIISLLTFQPEEKQKLALIRTLNSIAMRYQSIENTNQMIRTVQEVCRLSVRLISNIEDPEHSSNIVEAIAKIPSDQRQEVCEEAIRFMKDVTDGLQKEAILTAIAAILPEVRLTICAVAFYQIEGLSGFEKADLLRTITTRSAPAA